MQIDLNTILNAIFILAAATGIGCILILIYDEIQTAKSFARRCKSDFHNKTDTRTMTPTEIRTELDTLINQTKGKFFSISFVKNDGNVRVINGKDKYNRLLKGGSDTVRKAGFVPFVNRNTETWASAHNDRVVTFQCGKLKKEMQVSI
jgi:hypothetical protein